MEIRSLQDDEVEEFVDELWLPSQREMAATSYFTLKEEIRDAGLSHRHEQLSDDEAVTLVHIDKNRFTGYVTLEVQSPPPIFHQERGCHISELYVRTELRRQGIASDLLTESESWARSMDCEFFDLNVDKENVVAIELYEQIGFTVDRFTMRKSIDK